MPRVSIIMPVYNREVYISEAIQSLINQTFDDWELIVLDDASTDRTIEVIQAMKDPRIRLTPMPCKTSVPILRNFGIELATGDYVGFLDSDDKADLRRLQIQTDYLDHHPEVGVVSNNYQFFGGFDKFYKMPQSNREIVSSLIFRSPITNGSVLMRRAMLMKHGIRLRPEYFVCEDYALWVDLIGQCQMANLDETLLYVRAHDQQITSLSWKDERLMRLRKGILDEIHRTAFENLDITLTEDDITLYNLMIGDANRFTMPMQKQVDAFSDVIDHIATQAEANPELDATFIRTELEKRREHWSQKIHAR